MKVQPTRFVLVVLGFGVLFGFSLLNVWISGVPYENWGPQFGWAGVYLVVAIVLKVVMDRDKDS